MRTEFERNLDKYAEVIIKVGLNLQPGQRLLIGLPSYGVYGTPIELAPLVRLVVRKAYQAGARLVDVLWNDDQMRLIRFEEAGRDSFEEFPTWRTKAAYEFARSGDAMLFFYAEDPGLLQDQDPELVDIFGKTNWTHIGPTLELAVNNSMNWCVATAPVEGWVDQLYPAVNPGDRKAKFWDTLFEICRVTEADPISAWEAHLTALSGRAEYLNRQNFAGLKFSAPGTDLRIGLPKGHHWKGGRMTSQSGITFTANIPTEEIFTMPHRSKTEGMVSSTRSLNYFGSLIEDFTLSFSEGRVVKATAKKGEENLVKLLNTDKNSRRLGEVALVSNSSPISKTGMLFNNILLDENASSHVALGLAYKFSMENGEALSNEEFEALGGNSSMIHVDFMIGSKNMEVDGLREDGSSETIMRGGEWSFEV